MSCCRSCSRLLKLLRLLLKSFLKLFWKLLWKLLLRVLSPLIAVFAPLLILLLLSTSALTTLLIAGVPGAPSSLLLLFAAFSASTCCCIAAKSFQLTLWLALLLFLLNLRNCAVSSLLSPLITSPLVCCCVAPFSSCACGCAVKAVFVAGTVLLVLSLLLVMLVLLLLLSVLPSVEESSVVAEARGLRNIANRFDSDVERACFFV